MIVWQKGVLFITIDKIIENLPNILQYFVPGYVGLFCFRFSAAKKYQWETQLISSCVISFLLISLCNVAAQYFSCKWMSDVFWQVIISTCTAALSGFICALVVKSTWFDRISVRLFGISPHANVLESALDVHDGANIKIFFKDNVGFHVYGHYAGRDLDGSDQWLRITEPCLYMDNGEERQLESDAGYICRIADIKYMIVE